MMKSFRVATVLLLAVSIAGCGCMQKPWGKGALLGAMVGAGAGGTAGGVAGHNGAFDDPDTETTGTAAGIGIVAGGVLGALVGHVLFDKEAPAPVVIAAPPPPRPAPPPPAPVAVLRGTQFAFASAKLTPGGIAELSETLRSLKADRKLRISVQGHTDSVGSEAYNLKLSKRRAEAVKAYLVAEGVSADRVETRGFGESKPLADNGTAKGRAANRRVEVYKIP